MDGCRITFSLRLHVIQRSSIGIFPYCMNKQGITNSIVLYCTVLYCTVLYCTVLYCTVLYCTVLYCIVHRRPSCKRKWTNLFPHWNPSQILQDHIPQIFNCFTLAYKAKYIDLQLVFPPCPDPTLLDVCRNTHIHRFSVLYQFSLICGCSHQHTERKQKPTRSHQCKHVCNQ